MTAAHGEQAKQICCTWQGLEQRAGHFNFALSASIGLMVQKLHAPECSGSWCPLEPTCGIPHPRPALPILKTCCADQKDAQMSQLQQSCLGLKICAPQLEFSAFLHGGWPMLSPTSALRSNVQSPNCHSSWGTGQTNLLHLARLGSKSRSFQLCLVSFNWSVGSKVACTREQWVPVTAERDPLEPTCGIPH